MKCLYCDNSCKPDGDHHQWWDCLACGVCFDMNTEADLNDPNDIAGFHIKFERDLKSLSCALNLYPDANKTVLWICDSFMISDDSFPGNFNDKVRVIELDYCMTGVNQYNCLDKIKFMLLFQ